MILTVLSVLNLALCVYGLHVSSRPPSKRVPKKERAKNVDIFPSYVEFWGATFKVFKLIYYTVAITEIGACILRANSIDSSSSSSIVSPLLSFCPPSPTFSKALYPAAHLSSVAWIGALLALSGSIIRIWATQTLGPLFTWEVSIHPAHRLCTRGPYAIVRHPGYTGAVLAAMGQILFGIGRGTFFRECIGWSYPLAFGIGRWILAAYLAMGVSGVLKRSVTEDRLLKKTFGKEWEEYAERTPYRILPGIY